MFEEYLTLWHLKLLIIYTLANASVGWYLMWTNRRVKPDPKRDIDRFKPFVRVDYELWNPLIVPISYFFVIPRIIFIFAILFTCMFCGIVFAIGCDLNKPLPPFRTKLLWGLCYVTAHLLKWTFGCFTTTHRRSNVDYRKWLGPDWTPKFEGAPITISNHNSVLEIFTVGSNIRPMPGFVVSNKTLAIPGVGPITKGLGSIYLDRTDKNSRTGILDKIQERINRFETGEACGPLHIYVEGCTSNGEYLIKFKGGAFIPLKPVQPFVQTHNGLYGRPNFGDALPMYTQFLLMFNCLIVTTELIEMPVFAPNEYFWKHHWDGKDPEQKWQVFANAVREAMSEASGLQLSESTLQDKMDYKNLLYPKSKGKKDV